MPQVEYYSVPSNTAPFFAQWGSALSNQLANIGLVKTADTGQINWSSVGSPTVINTSSGYEIWRLNDTLQSTAPVYFKIEYGSAANILFASLWITVGTGTDGAGNINAVGLMRARTQLPLGNNNPAAAPCFLTSDGSSFAVNLFVGVGNVYAMSIYFERSRNASGVPTAEGVFIGLQWNAANTSWSVTPYGLQDTLYGATWAASPIMFPSFISGTTIASTASLPMSKDAATSPAVLLPMWAPNVTPWTSQLIVACHVGDAGAGALVQVPVNGATHTYRSVSSTFGAGLLWAGASVTPFYPLIIWE